MTVSNLSGKKESLILRFLDANNLDYIYYINGPEILTKHKDGKSWNISHDIWGLLSENREPLPTFNVTYKIKGTS